MLMSACQGVIAAQANGERLGRTNCGKPGRCRPSARAAARLASVSSRQWPRHARMAERILVEGLRPASRRWQPVLAWDPGSRQEQSSDSSRRCRGIATGPAGEDVLDVFGHLADSNLLVYQAPGPGFARRAHCDLPNAAVPMRDPVRPGPGCPAAPAPKRRTKTNQDSLCLVVTAMNWFN